MKGRNKANAKRLSAFVADAVSVISARLAADLKVDKAVADEMARNCAHDICARCGGTWLYVAKDAEFDLTKRDREIFERYKGYNMPELVAEYGVTHTRIYQIVAQVKREMIEKLQGKLPGMDG